MTDSLRVALVEPVTPPLLDERTVANLRALVAPGVDLVHSGIHGGPASVETAEQEEAATPGTVKAVLEAAAGGAAAAVVACVADVAVPEARSQATIPVVGPGEAALQLVAAYGGRASILIATEDGLEGIERLVRRAGARAHVASIRTLGMPIVDLAARPERTVQALRVQAEKAVVSDGADTIVIGCTVAGSARRLLHEHLVGHGLRVRVVDPLSLAVRLAATWAAHLRREPTAQEEDDR